jgi:hypothetical protein
MYICCLRVLTCTLVKDCCCSFCMFCFALFFIILVFLLAVYVSVFAVLFVLVSLYTTFVFFYEHSHVWERCICYACEWSRGVRQCEWSRSVRHCLCSFPCVIMLHRRRRTTSVIPQVVLDTPVTTFPNIVIIESCGEPKISLGVAQN